MIYRRKFVATIKKSFVIYNMNNNSLIETENSGRGLVLYFVDFSFFYYFMYLFIFHFYLRGVPWKYLFLDLKIFFLKKRQFIISAESSKNTLEEIFLSKVASLLAETWLTDELLNRYFSIILYTFGEHLL